MACGSSHAWGMTEMTPLGTVAGSSARSRSCRRTSGIAYRAKQGLPVPFVETRIMGQSGKVPWDGEAMGELEVRGPWVASRYYQAPELTGKWSDDGWFRTGDIGHDRPRRLRQDHRPDEGPDQVRRRVDLERGPRERADGASCRRARPP